MPGKLWQTLKTTWLIFSGIEAEERAAAFAYYALFSLFPLLALLLTLGTVFLEAKDIIHTIEHIAPLAPEQQKFIWQAVHALERERGSVSVLSIGILLWTSLRFFHTLVRAVNRAWQSQEIPWWQMPLKNIIMIATVASALLLGILAPAILQGLSNAAYAFDAFLKHYFPQLDLQALFGLVDPLRYALGAAILFYAFTILYMLAPRRTIPFRKVWFSALLVTVLLQLCQVAFVNYLPHVIRYNSIYGTVGGLMFLMLWIYFSGLIIILGGCLNVAIEKVWRAGGPGGPSKPEPSASA